MPPSLFVMAFGGAARLNVARVDRNADRLTIPGGVAPFQHRVKAIFPETIIFFPLSLNESQLLALADDSLASRVMFSGAMILSTLGLRLLAADRRGRHS